ncbi:MAG: YkgJ family cysteine cluster protein [Pseudomonadota bacterium]|nr:YkgJ family cysteine cluster protein [Pseudomonadota bacterium]
MTTPPTITLDAAGSPEANALLTTMLQALQRALRADPGDVSVLERALSEALVAYDAYLDLVVTAHPMSCRAGCTACCHDNPRGVTGVELERLQRAVGALPDAAAVRAHFARLAAARTDADTWRRRRETCPLLDAEGRCRAYAFRPLACRAFVAVTPADWCDPGSPSYAARVNPHLDPPRVILQILQALSARRGLVVATDLHTGMAP